MLVHTLASSLDSKLIERRRGESRLVERVKELIGAGSHAFTLVELARELKRSAAYLTDVFRRHEGVTIGRYQRRLRLSRSLVELRTADDLTSLALDLGFASHAHFSSAFKAEYGESPSAYRLRIRAASVRR
jgi:AraC-like DNA-binding protein